MFTISNLLTTIAVLAIGYAIGMILCMFILTRPRIYKWMLKKALDSVGDVTAWIQSELTKFGDEIN